MKTHFPYLLGEHGLASNRVGTEPEPKRTPTAVVGAIREDQATELAAQFARLGWRVKRAAGSEDARRLAAKYRAVAVVLPVESFAESGYLACAKLVLGLPDARVVLVGDDSEENERFALFAGAAGYATEGTPAGEIARLVTGRLAATAS